MHECCEFPSKQVVHFPTACDTIYWLNSIYLLLFYRIIFGSVPETFLLLWAVCIQIKAYIDKIKPMDYFQVRVL